MKVKIVISDVSDRAQKIILEELFKNNPDIEICEKEDPAFVDFSSHMIDIFNFKEPPQLNQSTRIDDRQKFKRYDYKKIPLKGHRR